MKKQWKGFLSGVLVSAMTMAFATSALAAYQKQATLDYTGISITLDGQPVIPTDANGNSVEPFAIDGTTYLPVRAVANAMGLGVDWEQSTQTVKLTSAGAVAEQPAEEPGTTEETVSSGEYTPVGAPGVGVSTDTAILGGPISVKVNSADGMKMLWVAKNNSGKTINYYTLHLSFYNRVGDPAYDQITHKSTKTIRTVGPVEPGEDLLLYSIVGYSRTCSKIVITDIDLEYADGTTETMPYWFATPDF